VHITDLLIGDSMASCRQFAKREVPHCVMQLEQKTLFTPCPEVNPFIFEFGASTMKSVHDLQTLSLLENGMCFGNC